MKFIDMFAGIGGFRSGLEKAGHKCVGYIEWDKFARQSYQAMYDTEGEFTANDIQQVRGEELPTADIWTFGSPCQNISISGNNEGLKGQQSRMFFEVIRLAQEKIRGYALPSFFIMENVKNLLSSNGGWDFARVLSEMDAVGYDVEWNVFNSAEVVPQNRERVYLVGHLRGKSTRKVFPIIRQSAATSSKPKIKVVGNTSKSGYGSHKVLSEYGISSTLTSSNYKHPLTVAVANKTKVKQVGNYIKTDSFGGNPQVGRVYDPKGVSPTLTTMSGGNRQPKILIKNSTKKGYLEASEGDGVDLSYPSSNTRRVRVQKNRSNTLSTQSNLGVVVRACLTPDRLNKRQNGRRFKENGEPAFTVTVADRNGVLLNDGTQLTIRKLTPLECWRLQGFTDEQFMAAKNAGVSDSQLYKQAGNAVTVPVVEAIGRKIAENELLDRKETD